MSALISFLGGNAFRLLFGEIFAAFTKGKEHKYEMQRMDKQKELDDASARRQQEGIKLQAEMGVKTIQVQSSADVSKIEAEAWLEAVKATTRQVGVKLIDGWNASIRPGVATWAVAMLTVEAFGLIVLSEFSVSVCAAALGIFLAERNLAKRGK